MDKLIAWLNEQPVGTRAKLARAIRRPPSYFSRQLSGDRTFSEADAIGIEKFSEGKVRCEDILPSVDWAFLRQSADVARETSVTTDAGAER